jgi:hypothetical protein
MSGGSGPGAARQGHGSATAICIGCCSPMSRALAELLAAWLRDFLDGAVVDIVPEDFHSGPILAAWIERLQGARVSVMCVAQDAIAQP